nr:odorant binding protein 43 [Monochamus saltuarius]
MNPFALIVCIFVFFDLVLGASIQRDVDAECLADPATYLDQNIKAALMNGQITDRAKVGAFLLCMYTRAGILNQDGTFNKTRIKEGFIKYFKYTGDQAEAATNDCAQEGPTPVESAVKMFQCWFKYYKPIG